MSLKDFFNNSSQKLVGLTDGKISEEVESEEFLKQISIEKNIYVPSVDFSSSSNFARYGSAERYYKDSIKNIYTSYPYDGSRKEKLEWRNNSSQLDKHILDNVYPKSTGYLKLSGSELNEDNKNPYIVAYGNPYSSTSDDSSIQTLFNSSKNFKSNNKICNLTLNRDNLGNTIEFWYKCNENIIDNEKNYVIFHISDGDQRGLWCGFQQSYGYNSLVINAINYSYSSYQEQQLAAFDINFNLDSWNSYSIVFSPLENGKANISLYVNGQHVETKESIFEYFDSNTDIFNLKCCIGARFSGGFINEGAFSSNGSIDDFRFWNATRTAKQIYRNWFTNINGGAEIDANNKDLGLYYKFNEGITTVNEIDTKVLDYSGFVCNGTIINYIPEIREVGSAFIEFDEKFSEEKDPIIYSFHPDVEKIIEEYTSSGSLWDSENNSNIYKSLPDWIVEEQETKGTEDLQNLIQIISSYFDTLHLQIENLVSIREPKYLTEQEKPKPFINTILSSHGFDTGDLFTNATIIEDLLSRNEEFKFDKSLIEIKNTIYQNIYNNLSYIYKSKGTEKSIRNVLRCFGIDEELIKINLYANNATHKLEDSYIYSSVSKKFADFNDINRNTSFIVQSNESLDADSYSYISGSSQGLLEYVPFTLQAEVIFPKQLPEDDVNFKLDQFNTVSLFGIHEADNDQSDYSWGDDRFSFYVTAQKKDYRNKDLQFKLSYKFKDLDLNETSGELTTEWFPDVYDNQKWNFAVKIKPQKVENINFNGATEYIIEFQGVNASGDIIQESFNKSQTVQSSYLKDSISCNKRVFAGAHYTDYTVSPGNLIAKSNVKISSVRCWLDYLTEQEIIHHAKDSSNFGRLYPYRGLNVAIQSLASIGASSIDTLALNWEFDTVTESDNNGEFFVHDISSGSLEKATSGRGWLGEIVGYKHPGRGKNFPVYDKQVVNKEFVYSAKQKEPETFTSSDLINIKNATDFSTRELKPLTYYFSIEKSMYQIINEEILKWFSTIISYNNLIGEPIEKYRKEYKNLAHMRKLFFENVGNTPDLEKFLEFFKWIDNSISLMVSQLIPASANISSKVNNVVESHILERNKVQYQVPIFSKKQEPIAQVKSLLEYNYSEQEAVSGTLWLKTRVDRREKIVTSNDVNADNNRNEIKEAITRQNFNKVPVGYDIVTDSNYEMNKDTSRNFSKIYKISGDETKKLSDSISPLNISNVHYDSQFIFASASLTGSDQILKKNKILGNFRKSYEYFQSSGRHTNNKALPDILDIIDITSSGGTFQAPAPGILRIDNRKLLNRPSVKNVFVQKFSSPGGSEVNSRGSLDKESEEFSPHSSINYRNLNVRKYNNKWLSESSSIDSENPSIHKVNKNTAYVVRDVGTKKQYDNVFISHQIPRSDTQYAWISASLSVQPSSSGYICDFPNINLYNSDTYMFLSGTDKINYLGLNTTSSYTSSLDLTNNIFLVDDTKINVNEYILKQNGPYQGAGWKNNFKYNNSIARYLKNNSLFSVYIQPENKTDKVRIPATLKSFREPFVEYNYPVNSVVEFNNSNEDVNLVSSYYNNKSKLSNLDLINATSIFDNKKEQIFDRLRKIKQGLFGEQNMKLKYFKINEQIFPKKKHLGFKLIRTKPYYEDYLNNTGSIINTRTFWKDDDTQKERVVGATSYLGYGTNKYKGSLTDLTSYNIQNKEFNFYNSLYSFIEPKESLVSTYNSKSFAPLEFYSTNFNAISEVNSQRGNLAPSDLYEISSLTTPINDYKIYMNSFFVYDEEHKNFYNPKNSTEFYNYLFPELSLRPVIRGLFSASNGVWIGGDLSDSYGNHTFTFVDNAGLTDTGFGAPGTGDGFDVYSCSSGVYGGCYEGSTNFSLWKYNGATWNGINGSGDNFLSVFSTISCSYGLIVAGDANNPTQTEGIRIWNGSTWRSIGAGCAIGWINRVISGSDGLYMAPGNGVHPIYVYRGSLAPSDTTSVWQPLFTYTNSGQPYDLVSSSNGIHFCGTAGVYHYKDTLTKLGDIGLGNNVALAITSNSSGLYTGGRFGYDNTTNKRLNAFAFWNIETNEWDYVGRSEKRSGIALESSGYSSEGIFSLISTDDKVYVGGYFNYIKSGPLVADKDGAGKVPNDSEMLVGKSLNDYVLPRPQLVFNNFIPPVIGDNSKLSFIDNNKNKKTNYDLRIVNNGYTNETFAVSNKKPFFDTFEEFYEDLKPISQKYSIIPEFTISDYIKDYLTINPNIAKSVPSDYLKLPGSTISSSFNNINKDYISTDALNVSFVQEEIQNDLKDMSRAEMNINISVAKKLLPKRDFYPSERVVTLGNYFINSINNFNTPITSAYNPNDTGSIFMSNGTQINGQIATLLQPLFAPGILLNTIKSGIAMDWPVYVANSGTADMIGKPGFYASTGSELVTAKANDPWWFGTISYNYTASNFLEQPPTFRLPFESLLDFDKKIPDIYKNEDNNLYYVNPTYYTSDMLTSSYYDEVVYPSYNLKDFKFKDSNYQLAMHNFLSEIPNFFLKDGQLTRFVSNKTGATAKSVLPGLINNNYNNQRYQYSMDVVLFKTNTFKTFTGHITNNLFKNTGFNKNLQYIHFLSEDSLYGPPMRFWNNINYGKELFSLSPYNLYSRLIDTPSYAPYAPPYEYGESVARITFQHSSSNSDRFYEMEDIVSNCQIEFFNKDLEAKFKRSSSILYSGNTTTSDNYSNSPAYNNYMKLDSSINLKGLIKELKTTFESNGGVISSEPTETKKWVIETKFETPLLNFISKNTGDNIGLKEINTNEVGGVLTGNYELLFKGIWTSYSNKQANDDEGVFIQLRDVGGRDANGIINLSLIDLCGFSRETKPIGKFAQTKEISEAVVMIPYTLDGTKNTKLSKIKILKENEDFYFLINESTINRLLNVTNYKKFNYKQLVNKINNLESSENSIINLMKIMVKYVLPPHLDWLKNTSLKPIVMYIAEAKTTLSDDDLVDIWQGLMPSQTQNTEFEEIKIKHKFGVDEFFHNEKLPNDLKFKTFKIKKQAKINYYNLTSTSEDNKQFNFILNNSTQTEEPLYSYNWPYDFFSLIELVNVKASLSYNPEDIDPLDLTE